MAAMMMKSQVQPSAVRRSGKAVQPSTVRVSGLRVAKPVIRADARRMITAVASTEGSTTDNEARWEAQIREGRVVNVTGQDAAKMMKEGWVLLDVRPPSEVQKVPVIGAVHVPLFVEDNGSSFGTLLSKSAHLGTGGWWLGGTHMVPNQNFLAEVQAKVPKETRIVVGCQKGLRSLAACEQLSRAGYQGGLAWINGGFDTCRKGDVPTPDNVDVRYAGIGGMSEVLGWTEVQQDENKSTLGGAEGVIKIFVVILALDLLLFAYEYITTMMQGGLPSN